MLLFINPTRYPKRHSILKELIAGEYKTLLPLCETRWIERANSIANFKLLLPVIQKTLTKIAESDHFQEIFKIRRSFENPSFIVGLLCADFLLKTVKKLSLCLQMKSMDLFRAQSECKDLIAELEEAFGDNKTFESLFEESKELSASLGFSFVMNRNDLKAGEKNSLSLFKKAIFDPMISSFIMDFKSRLTPNEDTASLLTKLLPIHVQNLTNEEMKKLILFYGKIISDEPIEEIMVQNIISQLDSWKSFVKKNMKDEELEQHLETLQVIKIVPSYAPAIKNLLTILATLPVSNATSERAFSGLKRIKTWLRGTMNEKRLTSIARMNLNNDLNVSVDEVIKNFASSKSRRLKFEY